MFGFYPFWLQYTSHFYPHYATLIKIGLLFSSIILNSMIIKILVSLKMFFWVVLVGLKCHFCPFTAFFLDFYTKTSILLYTLLSAVREKKNVHAGHLNINGYLFFSHNIKYSKPQQTYIVSEIKSHIFRTVANISQKRSYTIRFLRLL